MPMAITIPLHHLSVIQVKRFEISLPLSPFYEKAVGSIRLRDRKQKIDLTLRMTVVPIRVDRCKRPGVSPVFWRYFTVVAILVVALFKRPRYMKSQHWRPLVNQNILFGKYIGSDDLPNNLGKILFLPNPLLRAALPSFCQCSAKQFYPSQIRPRPGITTSNSPQCAKILWLVKV